jgi:hypothetical protein
MVDPQLTHGPRPTNPLESCAADRSACETRLRPGASLQNRFCVHQREFGTGIVTVGGTMCR